MPETKILLCDYGCGNEANYKTKAGKNICCQHVNSCPSVRLKNSKGLQRAYKGGVRVSGSDNYAKLSQEKKNSINWRKGKTYAIFEYDGSGQHKAALIVERGHKCQKCNLSEWQGHSITLELEHNDGDRRNNVKDNLSLLCPNCHSQTKTWRRGRTPGWKRCKFSDDEIIIAIKESDCLNQVLKKLDLRYGSAGTIINIMSKYQVAFMGS